MSKIKLTKSELKKQRDSLKQFRHYLPTLLLKKQQLQMKILEVRKELDERLERIRAREQSIEKWVGLLADQGKTLDLKPWVIPSKVTTGMMNIAGANIPFLKEVIFPGVDYDFYTTPFWVDKAVEELREYMKLFVEVRVLNEQITQLSKELRITTQRVNLFEKVKIPECLENIRRIRIYLGDQQANAVGISKVAKRKLEVVAV